MGQLVFKKVMPLEPFCLRLVFGSLWKRGGQNRVLESLKRGADGNIYWTEGFQV